MKPTILVTGGAGYIGSHTAFVLAQAGYQIVIIDDLLHKQPFDHAWARLIKADFSDEKVLEDVFEQYDVQAVMHFAAYIEVGESVKNPLKFYENNVIKATKLLKTMLKHGVDTFIFSSSCAVYGNPQTLPLTEKHPKNPVSPYGKTKYIVEMQLEDFHRAYGLKYVCLRYFNAAGALPAHGLGERHEPETHLIPLLLRAARENRPFYIFGDDYPTKDGSCVRDFLHVLDIAQAHKCALEYLQAGNTPDSFNLGTGHGYSVRQMISTVERICGMPINSITRERRAGDPPTLVADASKAQQLLGWQPQYSSLERIIQTAYDFELIKANSHQPNTGEPETQK